jgi:D-arabinose 1-dehydrogenase-like Zn-dependent alcohol dehydrogenase
MRAAAVSAYDQPLLVTDISPPELKHGHALLDVLACGVCWSDVKTSRGHMPFSHALSLPHIPGHEICGRVVETDPPGAMKSGTLVVVYHVWPCRVCARCRAGEDNLCRNPDAWAGFTHPGGFQEQIVAPLDRLLPVPSNIDPIHAAPMTCALGTAYHAVVTRGGVAAGATVAVIGLGGVGIHALQIAGAAGAQASGLDVSQAAIEAAQQLELSAYHAPDLDQERRLLAGADGEGIDIVIDTVSNPSTIAQANRLVRPGGRIVSVGYSLDSSFDIPTARFVLDEIELLGSRYVRMDELARAIRLVATGRIQTVVDRVEPLENANRALEALEAGEVVGRAVLDIAGRL